MKETNYNFNIARIGKSLCIAVVSDLHAQEPDEVIASLKKKSPDYILMPGDIFEFSDRITDGRNENGFRLLNEAVKIAPTFYSIGNHENGGVGSWKPGWDKKRGKKRELLNEDVARIKEIGAIFLDDSFVLRDGIAFGGLTSGLSSDEHIPNLDWLDDFCSVDGTKILLCHHPEYYKTYLKDKKIDLIVAGHAHGGQWRLGRLAAFAPGQGIFPKYTKGVYDKRLVVSTGLKKSGRIPRIFNEPEIVYINF
ncbi:MAG: serine/threonine protein phosphatase [Ruminococcaceae bacterium]|nr:serine/threonine protein phosphatase [Oscillospiraceae bacterium]